MEFLYDWFVQLGKSWNLFINTQPEELQEAAQAFKNLFVNQAYTLAFMVVIAAPLLMAAGYYWWYSRYPGFRYRFGHWFVWMILSLILVLVGTYLVIRFGISSSYVSSTLYLPKLAFINSVYALVVFALGSILITRLFSRTTKGCKIF